MYAIGDRVGDRVEAVVNHSCGNESIMSGAQGVVCDTRDHRAGRVGVAWDIKVCGGHDCSMRCEFGHGWYVSKEEIKVIEEDVDFEINEDEFMLVLNTQ